MYFNSRDPLITFHHRACLNRLLSVSSTSLGLSLIIYVWFGPPASGFGQIMFFSYLNSHSHFLFHHLLLAPFRGGEIANPLNHLQVFGKRQLSRRSNRNDTGYHPAHRHTDSSGAPSLMNGPDGDRKSNLTGTSRAIIAGPLHNSVGYNRHGDNGVNIPSDSAALVGLLGPNSPETISRGHKHTNSSSSAFTPTSPIVPSYPSGTGAIVGLGFPPGGPDSGPFYRPPRTRTNTVGISDSSNALNRGSWASGDWSMQRYESSGNPETPTNSVPRAPFGHVHSESLGSLSGGKGQGFISEDWDVPTALSHNNQNSGATTPPPFGGFHGGSVPHQATESTLGSGRGYTDYAVREMDFYYGVRGPALSSNAPSRKLGTGPADPTSPMAVAKGWLMNKFGRRKEKAKGFEVVRSSRAPQMLREMQEAAEKARKEKADKATEDVGVTPTSDTDVSSSEEENLSQGHINSRQVKTATDPVTDDGSDGDEGNDNYGEGPSASCFGVRAELRTLHSLNTGTDIPPIRSMSEDSDSSADIAPKVPRKSSKRRSTNLSLPSLPIASPHQTPEAGEVISPTPVGREGFCVPQYLSHVHLRQHEQTRCPSTRLPFQTSSVHSGSSPLTDGGGLLVDGPTTSPTSSRNNSSASSVLPHVPGLYNIHGSDSGSVYGNTGAPGRPASVGTVSRHRMEDSLTEVTDQRALVIGLGSTAELVERTNSMASIEGERHLQ